MKKLFASLLFCLIATPALASQIDYYIGELRTLSAKGDLQSLSVALAKRTLDPKLKVIIEEILHITAHGDTTHFTQVSQVNGDKYAIQDSAKRMKGEGKLFGKAWEWDRWDAAGLVDGKRRFTSRSHLAGGMLLVRKEFFDPAGKLSTVFSEEYRPISHDLYELLYTRLNQNPAKTPLS